MCASSVLSIQCSKVPVFPVCLWRPDLRDSDGAPLGQLLLGLLTGVRVCQMGVKIFIQNLCRLLAEVSPFPPGRKERLQQLTVRKQQTLFFHNVVSALSHTGRPLESLEEAGKQTNLASRNLERRIMTASHVLCFSCTWIVLNLRWMILTIRSISLGEMGRVRDCSLSRFITWSVNSLHACKGGGVSESGMKVSEGDNKRIQTISVVFFIKPKPNLPFLKATSCMSPKTLAGSITLLLWHPKNKTHCRKITNLWHDQLSIKYHYCVQIVSFLFSCHKSL